MRALLGELARQLGDASAALIVLREDEQRKSRPHERNRPVAKLRRAHRFRVYSAGLLEFERRFLRDREPEAAPHYVEIGGADEPRDRGAPVELPGTREKPGRLTEGRGELGTARPARDQLHDGRERGEVRLGRGDAALLAGPERDQII